MVSGERGSRSREAGVGKQNILMIAYDQLAQLVAEGFDLEAIERFVMASQFRRRIVKQAKDATGGLPWKFQPVRDATHQ